MQSDGEEDDQPGQPAQPAQLTVRDVVMAKANARKPAVKSKEIEKMPPRTEKIAMLRDPLPNNIYFVASAFSNEKGLTVLGLDRFPSVKPVNVFRQSNDFVNYSGRMSTWYQSRERKSKTVPPKEDGASKKNRLNCPHCPCLSFNQQRLSRHIETHYDIGLYVCQACHVCFTQELNMINHWKGSCPVSTHYTDTGSKEPGMQNTRRNVQCFLVSLMQSKLYYVFGGNMYIPSKHFLDDPVYVIMPLYHTICHLCCLHIPLKYLECHAEAHRGQFRIDHKIFGEYFCHICCTVFRYKENLLIHWRTSCPEVIAHTPKDLHLSDEELTGLVFLCLQQSIPIEIVKSMMLQTQSALDRLIQRHTVQTRLTRVINKEYFHFPQEIFPMQTYSGLDIINDSLEIQNRSNFDEVRKTVHNCNLMAMFCPNFYATGMTFYTFVLPVEKQPDKIAHVKTVLRYTTEGSVIKSYNITSRSFPQFQTGNSNYNTDEQYSDACKSCASKEKRTYFANRERSMAHEDRHKNNTQNGCLPAKHYCPLCHLLIFIRSFEEHWRHDCEFLKNILEPDCLEYVDQTFVNHIHRLCLGGNVKVKLIFTKQKITAPAQGFKPSEIPQNLLHSHANGNQPLSNLRDRVEVEFQFKPKAFEMIKNATAKEVEEAKVRYDRLQEKLERLKTRETNPHCPLICPHCGGKYDDKTIRFHLSKRHGYPNNDMVQLSIEEWSNKRPKQTIEIFEELQKSLKEENDKLSFSTLMTKNQYINILNYIQDSTRSSKDPVGKWSYTRTLRILDDQKIFSLINKPPDLHRMNRVLTTEKLPGGCVKFYPKVREIIEPKRTRTAITQSKSRSKRISGEEELNRPIWLTESPEDTTKEKMRKPPLKLNLKDVNYTDPLSGVTLNDELKGTVMEVDQALIGSTQAETKLNGVQISTTCDFFSKNQLSEETQLTLRDGGYQPDGAEDDERVQKLIEEDEARAEYHSDLDDEYYDHRFEENEISDEDGLEREEGEEMDDEEDEDDDDYGNDAAPSTSQHKPRDRPTEARLSRLRKLIDEKKKLRAEGKDIPGPSEPPRTEYKALKIKLDPIREAQIRYLSPVVHSQQSSQDDEPTETELMPLYPEIENEKSEYLANAVIFHDFYTRSLPKKNTNYRPVSSVPKRKKNQPQKLYSMDEMRALEDKNCAVQDEEGNVYIGGFVISNPDFELTHLEKLWIQDGSKARTMKVFKVEDVTGNFKFVWPEEQTSPLWNNVDAKLVKCPVELYKGVCTTKRGNGGGDRNYEIVNPKRPRLQLVEEENEEGNEDEEEVMEVEEREDVILEEDGEEVREREIIVLEEEEEEEDVGNSDGMDTSSGKEPSQDPNNEDVEMIE